MEWWKLDPSLAWGRGVLKCDKRLALYCLVMETYFSTPFSEIAAPMVMFPLLRASNIKIIKIRTTHMSSASSASFSVPPPSLSPLLLYLLPSCWPHLIPSFPVSATATLCCAVLPKGWMVHKLHLQDWSLAHLLLHTFPFVRESQQRLAIKLFGQHGIRN